MRSRLITLLLFALVGTMPAFLSGCDKNEEPVNPDIAGLDYSVTDPSEWNITPDDRFEFSYSVAIDSGVPAPLRIEIRGTSPDGGRTWCAGKTIPEAHPGRKYKGVLLAGERPEPGFYRCEAYINDIRIRTFNIACDLAEYNVLADSGPDFREFWDRALAELDKTAMDPRMEIVEHLGSSRSTVYQFTIRSAPDKADDDVQIRGWYREPKKPGKAPLLIQFMGYDDEGTEVSMTPAFANYEEDFAQLVVFTRGQGPNRRHPNTNRYGKWVVYGLESPETYYYRGAYLDAVRTVQFAKTLGKVDPRNIFVKGGSQGGALSLAAAALCPGDIRTAIIAFPFMGHFPLYLGTAKWPGNEISDYIGMKSIPRSEALRTLSYFDTKNMAAEVDCPVLLQMTLQDNVCPPWTQYPIFCNLKSKSLSEWTVDTRSGHAGSAERNAASHAFIMNHMVP